MAIKDIENIENLDRHKRPAENKEPDFSSIKKFPDNAPGIGEPDIKNAHATGDGSYGRNDSSLPEDEEEKKEDNTY
ncbi:MAG: hypothetical protein M3Y85_07465 [Bacteroidota bacterium]|nr:hypothetical protein [Bacteroidota bacterium]